MFLLFFYSGIAVLSILVMGKKYDCGGDRTLDLKMLSQDLFTIWNLTRYHYATQPLLLDASSPSVLDILPSMMTKPQSSLSSRRLHECYVLELLMYAYDTHRSDE
jgi:hypothetical protein